MVATQRNARRSSELAWLITGPLAFVALVSTLVLLAEHPKPTGDWPVGLLFFALFVTANSVVLMFEVRRQAFSVTLVEIPLLLGLYFLPPVTLILVRLLGSVVAQLYRRVPLIKLCFNTASHVAAAALASVLVFAAGPLTDPGPRTWLVLAGAVGLWVLVTLAAVVGVVTLVQGRISSRDLTRTAIPGLIVAGINTTIGLVVLVVLNQGPWSVFLLVALATCFV